MIVPKMIKPNESKHVVTIFFFLTKAKVIPFTYLVVKVTARRD